MSKHDLVMGIDLAGVSHRPTGICFLKDLRAETLVLFDDTDISDCAEKHRPRLITIDAPLSLPPGRSSIQDRKGSHFRSCDLELRRRKIPFFPITLGPMRKLTERGIKLQQSLQKRGIKALEVYPGGAQDILGLPRVKHDLSGLRQGLRRLGIMGLGRGVSGHQLDAATAAYVGYLYLSGKAEIYGRSSSGAIVMPLSR
ncbi:MAG: DUF429 domain-containing protein [Candidatus Aminicenantes bacterium]